MSLVDKIKEVKNSIVAIGVLSPSENLNIIGSGFAVDNNGTILSAAHLFKNLTVTDIGNLAALVAEKEENSLTHYKWLKLDIIDKKDESDAAVLKIQNTQKTLLRPLNFGNVNNVKEGKEVYFIGFPYAMNLIKDGFGVTMVTNKGIISSVKRKSSDPQPLDWFIIDAISNPGNSGCPLIDVETNKVIGIMSIAFRIKSQTDLKLDIREPMHIAGAKPISYAKSLFKKV